jgi:hypothetical protein
MTERESIRLWSTTAASNGTADPQAYWPENQLPSTVNNSARAMMAAEARQFKDTNGSLASTGSANAYALTINNTWTAYATGQVLSFKANFTNSAAATLNVTNADAVALGAKAIRVVTTSGESALAANMIRSGGHYMLHYDAAANSAAGAFILVNPSTITVSGDTVHVEEYGAFPDGTDQSANIQAAVNAMAARTNGGMVLFNAATYRSGTTITVPRGVSLVGQRQAGQLYPETDNVEATVIKWIGTGFGPVIKLLNRWNGQFSNIQIDGNSTAQAGLWAIGPQSSLFDSCSIVRVAAGSDLTHNAGVVITTEGALYADGITQYPSGGNNDFIHITIRDMATGVIGLTLVGTRSAGVANSFFTINRFFGLAVFGGLNSVGVDIDAAADTNQFYGSFIECFGASGVAVYFNRLGDVVGGFGHNFYGGAVYAGDNLGTAIKSQRMFDYSFFNGVYIGGATAYTDIDGAGYIAFLHTTNNPQLSQIPSGDDTTTNSTMYPVFSPRAHTTGPVSTAIGYDLPKTASTKLTFNPSTGRLGATYLNGIWINDNNDVTISSVGSALTFAGATQFGFAGPNNASAVVIINDVSGTHSAGVQFQQGGTGLFSLATNSTNLVVFNAALNKFQVTFNADGRTVFGTTGSLLGQVLLAGSSTGSVTIAAQAAAGTPTLTLPNASGTFAVSASSPLSLSATTGALTVTTGTLTASNDTNVTLSLGGTPTNALFNAVSLTLGWTGTLALSRLAQGTDGQLVVGQTSSSPLYKTISGDWTLSAAGAATLATVNSNVGTFGSATQSSQVTVNAKGLVTAAANVTVTPAVGSITGLGTGVATFLGTPSSANLAAALTDETGSGKVVFSAGTLDIASGKTATVSNTLTLTATDGSTLAIGAGGTLASAAYKATGTSGNTVPLLDGANTWSALQTFSAIAAANTFSGTSPATTVHAADYSSSSLNVSVADNSSSAALPSMFAATIFIVDDGTGAIAFYSMTTAAGVTMQWEMGSEFIATTTSPGAGKSSFADSGSGFKIYNHTGATRNYRAIVTRIR